MLKVDLYNFEGKKKEAVAMPKEYDVKPNLNLLSQAIHVYEDRTHFGLAKTKTRGEVAISTRKIYKQKGTGGARHGPRSAPIFVGGGTAHGPTGLKRVLHLSRSQRRRALLSALNYKISDSKVVLLTGIEKIKKTKEACKLIKNILKDRNWKTGKNIFVALSDKNIESLKVFRNIDGVITDYYKNLNAYKVYLANGLIVDEEALEEKKEIKEVRKEEIKVSKTRLSRVRLNSGGVKQVGKKSKTIVKSRTRKPAKI